MKNAATHTVGAQMSERLSVFFSPSTNISFCQMLM